MFKLRYIGKSNKNFTHDHLYGYMGSPSLILDNQIYLNIAVITNKKRLKYFNSDYIDYFQENFQFLNEKEIKQFQRQQKLKKINGKFQ